VRVSVCWAFFVLFDDVTESQCLLGLGFFVSFDVVKDQTLGRLGMLGK